MGPDALGAEERSSNLAPQVLQEIAKVEAEIDRTEAQAIERLARRRTIRSSRSSCSASWMLYDKDLSVKRNEACAFCHMPRPASRARCRS